MLYAMILIAQNGDKAAEAGSPWYSPLFMFGVIAIWAYLFLIAPGRRERQQRVQLLSALKKNDEVLTSAGILGVVANIKEKEDEVTLKIDDNARIRVLKSSIVRIMNPKEPGKELEKP